MNTTGFTKGKVLLPTVEDMAAWSVIACDQFSSQPRYWREVEERVKNNPSTFHMMIPDCRFQQPDLDQRLGAAYRAMRTYVRRHVLREVDDYIYVERGTSDGRVRSGLVGVLDLEEYDYCPDCQKKIRASERNTEMLAFRRQLRENASLEVSHIMLLMDDRRDAVMSLLRGHTAEMEPLYDFQLMKDGGPIRGWRVSAEQSAAIDAALEQLSCRKAFEERYNMPQKETLIYVVGDGNMSLAAAKDHYEHLKRTLSPEKLRDHPARYALCELVNLNDPSLVFEPINRLVFGVDVEHFTNYLEERLQISYQPVEGAQSVEMLAQGQSRRIWFQKPSGNMAAGSLQNAIDDYVQNFSGKVDYVHGSSVVKQLSALKDNVGFLLPAMEKGNLFPTILLDQILPRKTFSMGQAEDKRFYLECRKIVK